MWSYRKRLERDLDRWREAGWVTASGEAAIRADLETGVRAVGLAPSLAILGAVLMGFAVMSFVAANWQDMARAVRLALLFGLLWASYGLAGFLLARGLNAFAHASILLGTAIFGASIMLISQMYHVDGNPPDAVLVWGLGALLAGVLLKSNPALALAMVLVGIWGMWETGLREEVFWPFLLGWGAVSAAFYWRRWRPGLHLSGLALSGFLITLGYILHGGHGHVQVVAIGLAIVGLAMAGERVRPELTGLWPGTLGYGAVVAFAGLYALQFVESPEIDMLILLAVLTLALLIAAIFWGLKSGNRGALWLGYSGFSIEILGVYSKTIGTLLNTSLFFLIAGLIVCGLAALAYRLHSGRESREVKP
ncbi:MAG TPA: DUF2157 domain-containing protein [Hyphomicrobiaceae bacterium]|nr:DUF2157 domain-containing protein [Hyphomicrobiaceae bacterium]